MHDADAAAAELVTLLQQIRPQVVVTFDRGGCSGHPDHVVCHDIGVRAATALSMLDDRLCGVALIADPVPHRRRRDGASEALIHVDVAGVRQRKTTAIRCHFSQVGDPIADQSRFTRLDPASGIARFAPQALSPRSQYEGFVWLSAEQLAVTGCA